MALILPNGMIPKKANRGAFSGKLTCPKHSCGSNSIRLVEKLTEFRYRYRCRKCGFPFQYDISGAPPGFDGGAHPYAPFKKGKFQRIVENWKRNKGAKKVTLR